MGDGSGRTAELRWLDRLCLCAHAGRASVALIDGAPGVGKSWLVRRFSEKARHGGIVVVEHPPEGAVEWSELGRRRPVLLVVTRRTGVNWPTPDDLAMFTVDRLRLGPLPPAAIAVMVRGMVADPDRALLELARIGAGNPGAVVDLVSELRDEGLLRTVGGRTGLAAHRLPTRARMRLETAVAELGRPARNLIQLAATSGETIQVPALARTLGTTPAALLPALDEAFAAGLLTGTDGGLRFSHGLVRSLVASSLPGAVRAVIRTSRAPSTSPAAWSTLTPRERVVAGLAAKALTNQQIATRLGRSPHTVNYHLRQVFRKLGITSRVELARLARPRLARAVDEFPDDLR